MEGVKLVLEPDAIDAIIEKALELKTGARALRSIIEQLMMDAFFTVSKDKSVKTITITKAVVCSGAQPVLQ